VPPLLSQLHPSFVLRSDSTLIKGGMTTESRRQLTTNDKRNGIEEELAQKGQINHTITGERTRERTRERRGSRLLPAGPAVFVGIRFQFISMIYRGAIFLHNVTGTQKLVCVCLLVFRLRLVAAKCEFIYAAICQPEQSFVLLLDWTRKERKNCVCFIFSSLCCKKEKI
jgi:hypothetical protein